MDWAELWDRFLSIFFPRRCVLCDAVVEWEDLWCGRCPCQSLEGEELLRDDALALALISALGYDDGPVTDALIRMKKQPDRRASLFFAQAMAERVRGQWPDVRFDVIVPVPISEAKRRERGFNHAALLAGALGQVLGLPVSESALRQLDTALLQTFLNLAQRRENAATAFLPGDDDRVVGKAVLLVDNLCASGATLLACARQLHASGAGSVRAVTAARPQKPVANPGALV